MLREFRIGDVFEKIQIKPIGKKAGDFPGSYSPSFPVPLLTSGTGNQGLSRYAGRQDCPDILHGCISIASNGAAGAAYYQPGPFAVLQDAYAVTVKDRGLKSEPEGLYLAAAVRKVTGRGTYGWTNKAGWEKVKLEKISLPVKESPDPDHAYTPEDIDWEHMDAYIRKLMEKNVKELDAYLKAAGLEDYELTDEDREVLSLCGRGR